MNNLFHWLTTNELTLNIKKTNFVIFCPQRNYPPQISIFDNEGNENVLLEYKNYIKFIGLLIEGNFTWKDHIRTLTTKINKTVALIAKLRHIVPNRILLNIYKFLIVPYITHGLTSWGNAS